jgi:hypothetical protein
MLEKRQLDLDIHMKMTETRPPFFTMYKNQFKMYKKLKLWKSSRETLQDKGTSNVFLDKTPMVWEILPGIDR